MNHPQGNQSIVFNQSLTMHRLIVWSWVNASPHPLVLGECITSPSGPGLMHHLTLWSWVNVMMLTLCSCVNAWQMTVSNFLLNTLDFKESFYPYCALIMVGGHGIDGVLRCAVGRPRLPNYTRLFWLTMTRLDLGAVY